MARLPDLVNSSGEVAVCELAGPPVPTVLSRPGAARATAPPKGSTPAAFGFEERKRCGSLCLRCSWGLLPRPGHRDRPRSQTALARRNDRFGMSFHIEWHHVTGNRPHPPLKHSATPPPEGSTPPAVDPGHDAAGNGRQLPLNHRATPPPEGSTLAAFDPVHDVAGNGPQAPLNHRATPPPEGSTPTAFDPGRHVTGN
jgi:hypothetical protein